MNSSYKNYSRKQNYRILFVAPSSYPLLHAESNVNAKVIKLLSEVGCSLDLICRTPRKQNYTLNSKDDMFFGKVKSISSITVNSAMDLKTVWRHFKTFFKFGVVYKGADWAYVAAEKCDELVAKNKYDFVYTFDYPSELVGLYLAKKYRLKWVATWNDPYIWDKYPHPYGKGSNCKVNLMRRNLITMIGKYTFRNVFPSVRLRDYMLQYMKEIKKDGCVIIPHVVCDELTNKIKRIRGEVLKIIHSGALGKERDPQTLFEGMRIFIDSRPDVRVELSLLGVFERISGKYVVDLIKDYNLEEYVKLLPPVSYSESLDIVQNYDVCLVLEADLEVGIFLPSKIADYLQVCKPIFSISPEVGLLNDEYKNGIIDYFANVKSAKSIATELSKIYDDYEKDELGNARKDDSKYHNDAIIASHCLQIFN